MIEKLKAHMELLKIAAIGIALVLLTSMISQQVHKSELEKYIQDYELYKARSDSAVAFADSIKVVNDSIDAVVQRRNAELERINRRSSQLRAERDSLRGTLGSLETNLASAENCADSLTITTQKVDNLTSQLENADSLNTENLLKIGGLNNQLRDVNLMFTNQVSVTDSLRMVIQNQPDAPENPDKWFFGLLNKPSRTSVAVASAAVGAVAAVVILK